MQITEIRNTKKDNTKAINKENGIIINFTTWNTKRNKQRPGLVPGWFYIIRNYA